MRLPTGGPQVPLQRLEGPRASRLLDLDFSASRESLLSHALATMVDSMTVEELHGLPLCDRHALVRAALLLEGITRLEVPTVCPGCQAQLELVLDVHAIRLPRLPRNATVRASRRKVRLPRPADLARASSVRDLVRRLGGSSLAAAEAAWERSDPMAEVQIVGRCPQCGQQVSVRHDPVLGWLDRLRRRARALVEEVHTLALHYHWSEQEILSLPEPRRRTYLDLCAESQEEIAHAG